MRAAYKLILLSVFVYISLRTKLASQSMRPCVRDTMRVLRECRDCVCPAVSSYPSTTHHSSIGQVQQLWNKWEIQMMVMVSFSLQVFLLSLAGFRKRHSSSVLNMVLWLAYLSADSVAVFVLGRLTLYTGEPRHQLLLFWAPFVLFHLGGQETITAFSMEDCKLWKRHLLNLTTQVSLATYVVAKQWHGGNQLVAPMVFMFISGTVKYAERIWALKVATETREPGSSSFARLYFSWFAEDFYNDMANIISQKDEKNFRRIMESVQKSFWLSLHFVMDVTPSVAGHGLHVLGIVDRIEGCEDSANHLVYRIAEIHLSLLCDYLYTRIEGIKGVVRRFITLVLTSIALALFLAARVQDMGYSRADVTISYILLVGALMMEISSILMWVLSPYWPYMSVAYLNWYADYYRSANRIRILVCEISKAAGTVLLHVIRCTPRPENRVEWSRKMKQYNMLHGCIHEKQAGRLEKMMRCIGIKQGDCITHVVISAEVKKLLLGKLVEIKKTNASGGGGGAGEEGLSWKSFDGKWARRWAFDANNASAAHRALEVSKIQGSSFVSSVYLWHIVTDICLLVDDDSTSSDSNFKIFCHDVSNYTMYLVAKRDATLDSSGYFQLKLAHDVSLELLKPEAEADRWELIAMVWVEMLCYIALNCGAEFHAKALINGGEFVSHVKIVLFILGFCFS